MIHSLIQKSPDHVLHSVASNSTRHFFVVPTHRPLGADKAQTLDRKPNLKRIATCHHSENDSSTLSPGFHHGLFTLTLPVAPRPRGAERLRDVPSDVARTKPAKSREIPKLRARCAQEKPHRPNALSRAQREHA